ncbi:MAG: arsenite efflux transporter metallochaperone ArsD [Planctomycetota bacterium]
MAGVQVFDRAMCCSTGVCGPDVDPALVQFASDLEWLRGAGHRVDRFNLAQQPAAFAQHTRVRELLTAAGPACLPLVFVDGALVSQGFYPQRSQLAGWIPAGPAVASAPVAAVAGPLQILDTTCDPGSGCC